MFGIGLPTLPDLLIFEIDRGVLLGLFKKDAEHIHVQGLTEASRPGKKRNHWFAVKEIPDQQSFVHVAVVRGCGLEVGDADRQRLFLFAAVHYNSIFRNHPGVAFLNCTRDLTPFAHLLDPADSGSSCFRGFGTGHVVHIGCLQTKF